MATVTGMTAAAMTAIRDQTVVSGALNASGHLILTQYDGTEIDAGYIPDAVPAATSISAGIVELATSAEVLAGTDNVKAVTPAGLASIPGSKVQIVSGIAESATPDSAYPVGISLMNVTTGWSLNGGNGTVVTNYISTTNCEQSFYSNDSSGGSPRSWTRRYNGSWTAWTQNMLMVNLNAAGFVQSTVFTAYPAGQSRLYYTSITSSSWDFTGMSGEVITYTDGVSFAKQTFTQHVGGTLNVPKMWIRTANTNDGWTNWRQIIFGDQIAGMPTAITSGQLSISPTQANHVTQAHVTFPAGLFTATPNFVVTANSTVPGTGFIAISGSNVSATGADIYLYRTDTTTTIVWWMAIQN